MVRLWRNLKFEFNVIRFQTEQNLKNNPDFTEWLLLGFILGIISGYLIKWGFIMQLKHQAINLESEFYKTKKLLHDKIKDSKSMDCEQLCNLYTSPVELKLIEEKSNGNTTTSKIIN